jgi:hypothetical protein
MKIIFRTKLILKSEGEIIDNETELLGIGRNDLTLLMDVAGLTDIILYDGFGGSPFSGKNLPLVISSRKHI